MFFYQILVYTMDKKNTKSITKSRTKTINLKYHHELPGGLYSVSDIQDYFGYIIRKHV